jgi:hypothetical protein
MTVPTWPATVPFVFLVDGFSHQPVSNSMKVDPEVGEPLTRQRFTGEIDDVSGTLTTLTTEQVNDLRNFYRYDLKDGSLRFTQDDPMIGEAREYLFMAPPRFTPIDGDLWRPQIQLQAMP